MARDPSPRLGRGLAALLGDAPQRVSGEAPAEVRGYPVASLEPGPFQPRRSMAKEAMAELAQSIAARGVLQPLLIRPHPTAAGRFQIIAGERRWRAAQQAGLAEVPALARTLSDTDAMAASLVENLQRQDLNPIEEAQGYKRLMDEFGMTQERLSEAVGKSRSHVANVLRLLHLPEPVRAAVEDGRLSAGHAKALLGHADPERLAQTVLARGLNVRQTEALARDDATGTASAPQKDPETAALERDLSEKLGLRVAISFDGKGGKVVINYRSLDQLDGVIALLSPAA